MDTQTEQIKKKVGRKKGGKNTKISYMVTVRKANEDLVFYAPSIVDIGKLLNIKQSSVYQIATPNGRHPKKI